MSNDCGSKIGGSESMEMDWPLLAKQSYEAYRAYRVAADPGHCSAMFHWEQLPEKHYYREAWVAAVRTAVSIAVEQRREGDLCEHSS